jgi:hypothetical protein
MLLDAFRTYGKYENANWDDNIKIDHKTVGYVLVLTTSRQIPVTAILNRIGYHWVPCNAENILTI